MNVLEYLQNGGNVIKNPDYNPKTKKGRLQSPTLINYKPGDNLIDQALSASIGSAAGLGYNLNKLNPDNYADYDVYINPVQTQEELDKERAINQSNWEQTGRALVNAAAEVGLGIPIGFADIADAILNIGNDNNDYQNILSSTLTDWKKAINERMEVYRENPNEAFDVGDYAWWMSNLPSIVSSLSLMVPGIGVSTAISKLGRGLSYLNKVKSLNKVTNKFNNFVNLSNKTRDTLGAMGKAAVEGATMRVGENYIEARETYNQIKDYASDQLKSMTNAEREEFYNNNPQYRGMDDNDIIEDIASNSADTTFNANLINGVFDILQIYGMRNMWNNRITNSLTNSTNLNRINKLSAKLFGQDAKAIQEAAKGSTLWGKTKNGIIDFLDDTIRLGRTEWTEGVEEAINYVGSQEGIYAGKKVFDKDLNNPQLNDYLRDPHLWESAFWGVMGGVVFGQAYPAVVKGIGKLHAKHLGKEYITAEKQKEAEIYSRSAITENYINELAQIESGQNPFDNNNPVEEQDKEALKQLAGKRYIDALVVNAANAGNLDLLETFMHDSNFNKGFREKLNINEQQASEILTQFDNSFNETKQTYMDVLNKANRAGASFDVAKIIASEAVDAKHGIDTWTILKNNAQTRFNSLINQNHLSEEVGKYIEDAKDGIILNEIELKRKEIAALENNPVVKKKTKEESLIEANKDIDRLLRIRPVDGLDDTTRKIKLEAARRLFKEQREIFDAYIQLAQKENVLYYAQENNKTDDVTIKNKVTEKNNFFDSARKKIVDGAFQDIADMYRKYDTKEVIAQINNQDNNISEEDKKIIDNAKLALQLNEPGNEVLNRQLKEMARIADIEKQRIKESPEDNITDEALNNQYNGAKEHSPTGGGTQSSSTDSVDDGKASPPVEEIEEPKSVFETPQPQSQQTNQTQGLNIPSDELEQTLLAQEQVELLLDDFGDEEIADSTKAQMIHDSILAKMKAMGFQENIASENIYATLSQYNSMASGDIQDAAIRNKDAIKAGILNFRRSNNENNLYKALEVFINTENNGVKYGREYNGKIYFSMSDLMAYLKNIPNEYLYREMFDSLKTYIFSTENTQFVVTDSDTIKAIDKFNLRDYVHLYERARRQLIKDISNEVNIDNLFEGTNEEIAARIVEFSKLKEGKQLAIEFDNKSKRLFIKRDGKDIGYMGTANEFDSEYAKANEGWMYTLNIDVNKIVHSDLMNWMFKFITDDKLNDAMMQWFDKLDSNSIDFKNPPIYDEYDVNSTVYKAYNQYADFVDWLFVNGGSIFSEEQELKVVDKAIMANHIIKVLKRGVQNRDTNDVYKWFEHMAASYLMAEELKTHPTKKVVVSRILPGNINTEQTTKYEGNVITDTVVGYNENEHQLGVIIDKQLILSKNETPINVEHLGGTSNLNVVIRIPRPDGTETYAACTQTLIKDVINNANINKLINGVLNEVRFAVDRFYKTDGPVAFDNLFNHLSKLFGDNGLIRGINIYKNKNGSVSINHGRNTIIFFNPTTAGKAKNMNDVTNKAEPITYYNASSSNAAKRLSDIIESIIKTDATFAIGKDFINDGTVKNNTSNPFILRENGKTIIQAGGFREEYNSYQDFLVKNNLVKTKLRNDKTPRIVQDGVIAYGNFVYSKEHTGLQVRLPIIVPKAVGKIPVAREITDLVDTNLTSENIDDIVETVNDADNFKDYLKALSESTGLLDKTLSDYYTEIHNTGILQLPIEVKYRSGYNAYAYYNRKTEKVYIDRSKWEKDIKAGKATTLRFLNVIIHENIHGYIDAQNKAGNNLSKKITQAFTPIYKEYRKWFDAQSEEFRNNKNNKTLARIKDNNAELTDIDYEEFMIESMTNHYFMEQLNNIKTTPSEEVKKPTLFAKIMNIIAKLFGVNIKSDSLLAKARAAAQSVIEDNSNTEIIEDNNDKGIIENNEPHVEENDEDFDDDNNDNDREQLPFAATEDVLSISDTKNRLPYSIQAKFDALLDAGVIGFMCK